MRNAPDRPPRAAERLLGRMLGGRNRQVVIGDFEEIYHDILEARGRAAADAWYGLQIVKSLAPFILNALFWGSMMFRNYLKVFARNFRRHLGFSLINLAGLALGMGCCLLISLWVVDEMGFDRFHSASDRLYRIESDEEFSGTVRHGIGTPIPLASAMEKEIPEVEYASRFSRFGGLQLAIGDHSFFEADVVAADPSFLSMFSFPLIEGSKDSALSAPLSVLVSKRMAEKYFTGGSPVGKTVRAENRLELTVTGVLRNPPSNSSLQFDWVVPFAFVESRLNRMPEGWVNAVSSYTRLRPGTSPAEVAGKITALVRRHQDPGVKTSYTVEPLTRIRLFFRTGRGLLARNIYYVYVYSLVGLLVLGIACINFMNLSTARSAERAREIGLRKVVGAHRANLVRQFYGESLLYVLSALGLAAGMTALLVPAFNAVTRKQLSVSVLAGPGPLAAAAGIVVLAILLSGSYPAAFLSRLQPAGILRGVGGGGARRATFRKVLVVVQFTLSIILLIGTSVVLRQTRFLKTEDVGFDRENLVLIPLRGGVAESYPALKAELTRSPSILGVTAMSRRPDMIGDYAHDVDWEGKEAGRAIRVSFASVAFDFTETVGLKLAAGRDFSPDRATDAKSGFLVNEEMAGLLGRPDVLGARLSMFGREGTIVGVLENFHFQPMHQRIEPLVLLLAPNANWLGNIVIRLRPGRSDASALDDIKAAWKRVIPGLPCEYAFLNENFSRMYWREVQMGQLLEFFTALAVLIACLGLFGLSSYITEQRTKEIGIRKVMGESVAKIVFSLSKESAGLALVACLLAWPTAYLLARRWLDGFAYRTTLGLPLFLLAGLAAVAIAVASVSYQSVKAARTDPVKALRYE
ncbi:MAG: ABC transporter permease [Candidatus Aminicenantes bacterium]|nr:ABC transporter permease [Candidatus Aminicenantes bacterium]